MQAQIESLRAAALHPKSTTFAIAGAVAPAPRSEIAQDAPAAAPQPAARTPPPATPTSRPAAEVEKAAPPRPRAHKRMLASAAALHSPAKPAQVRQVASPPESPNLRGERGLAVPPPPFAEAAAPQLGAAFQPLRGGLALALDAGEFAAATNRRLLLGAADAVNTLARGLRPEPDATAQF